MKFRARPKRWRSELNVRGLMNVQFAVKGEDVYVLEVNPRASRTAPFVSKAIGVPLAKLAAKVMAGKTLSELGFTKEIVPKHFSVKEPVFPFLRYQGSDTGLGPEMKSTGEVMGIDADLGLAYAKAQMAAPPPLPKSGKCFHQRERFGQGKRRAVGARLHRARFRRYRDQRNGGDVSRRGNSSAYAFSNCAKAGRTCSIGSRTATCS